MVLSTLFWFHYIQANQLQPGSCVCYSGVLATIPPSTSLALFVFHDDCTFHGTVTHLFVCMRCPLPLMRTIAADEHESDIGGRVLV